MALISNMMWIDKSELSDRDLFDAMRDLTVFPKASPMDETPPEKITQYVIERGRIGVPFAYGEGRFPKLKATYDVSYGESFEPVRLPDPNNPKAPKGQGEFFGGVVQALKDYNSVLAIAPTGSGKTVAILNAIGTLRRTAIVVVPSVYLADQWKEEAMRHLGLEWKEVGILQGASDDWRGKKIVVAVIHNLFLKKWPKEFHGNFGFVAWDECHRLGARVFSSTMFMFNARYRLAVSATPDRKDGCDALYKNYFGEPLVVAKSKALPCACYVVPFKHIGTKHEWIDKCRSDVKPMQWLSKLKGRNKVIIDLALALYDSGRNVLILTKYIEHVELLIQLLVAAGVPKGSVGQFTRSTSSNAKHGKGFLEKVKTDSDIIVATFPMMKEGVDIPRLDAGIEALPSADCVQAIGRIRRPLPGKRKPKWFSISDLNIPIFEAYTKSRLRGFREANVEIHG